MRLKALHCFPPFGSFRKKRVMQFQSRLLMKLALTTNTDKNWRNQVTSILSEAAEIIDIFFLYAFIRGENGKQDIEVFWLRDPSDNTRRVTLAMLEQRLGEDRAPGKISVCHSIAKPGSFIPEIAAQNVDVRTQTFGSDSSIESGTVGIGLPSHWRRGSCDDIIIESTLTAFASLLTSVNALSAYRREVERFATRDPLTNLYNQVSFWDLLEYETKRSHRQEYKFSLLVIDLDNFKAINDTYGHETGDSFLREFSVILKSSVRSGDIAARYAGDQFTAILPVCDEGQAFIVAQRIIEGLRKHTHRTTEGVLVRVTASVGVAVFPDHAREAKDLFLLADNMVTQSKTYGKDRLSMPSEQDDVEVLKSMGEKNILILEALSQRRIVPYFQPIMNLSNQQIEAVEVLTRIVLPDRVVAAAEFIETAESMGVIGKLDYQLFELALAKVCDCNYAGDLFINLSPRVLVLNDFMPTIRKTMRDHGFEPSRLVFEITERDTVKNLKLIEKFIGELKQEGFRFAIDDFGSGYSSFQYIRTFSVDFLKVDGEFIRNMGNETSTEKQIVTSIADLACRLGIKTIAESVETGGMMSDVQAAGINYGQGYYIKRPSPDLS
jgi:diguanylate cyclase (GGDEF)-like protein